jgi:hypothetical protein
MAVGLKLPTCSNPQAPFNPRATNLTLSEFFACVEMSRDTDQKRHAGNKMPLGWRASQTRVQG